MHHAHRVHVTEDISTGYLTLERQNITPLCSGSVAHLHVWIINERIETETSVKKNGETELRL